MSVLTAYNALNKKIACYARVPGSQAIKATDRADCVRAYLRACLRECVLGVSARNANTSSRAAPGANFAQTILCVNVNLIADRYLGDTGVSILSGFGLLRDLCEA